MKHSVSVTLDEVLEFIKNNLLELKFRNDTNDNISLKETGSKFELSFGIQTKEIFKIVEWMLTDDGYEVKSVKLSEDEEYNFEIEVEDFNKFKSEEVKKEKDILSKDLKSFLNDFLSQKEDPIISRLYNRLGGYFHDEDKVLDLLEKSKKDFLKIHGIGLNVYERLIKIFKEVGIDTDKYPISGNVSEKKK